MKTELSSKQHRLFDSVFSLLLFFAVTWIVYLFGKIEFDPHHTGLVYKTALDIANGKVLFRETFTQYGALSAYIQALFICLFGARVTSVIFASAVFYGLNFVLLYRLARRFLGRALSGVTVCAAFFLCYFWFWSLHPWSSDMSLFFLLLTADLLLRVESKRRYLCLLLAGVCASLTFWCRQPVGLVVCFAAALCVSAEVFLYQKGKKQTRFGTYAALALVGGVLVGLAALLIPIAAGGALKDFYRQSISCMFSFAGTRVGAEQYGAFFGSLGMLLYCLFIAPVWQYDHSVLNIIWIILPLCSLALWVLVFCRMIRCARKGERGSARDLALFVYTLCAVGSWHQYFPVNCYRHWFWGAFPSVLSVVLLAVELVPYLEKVKRLSWLFETKKRQIAALVLVLTLLFVPNAVWRIGVGAQRVAGARGERFENAHYAHLNGLYLAPEVAEHYGDFFDSVALLRTYFPELNVINMTENGIYAVFAENFCPLFNNAEDYYYEEYPDLLEQEIAEHRPALVTACAPDDSYVCWRELKGDGGDPNGQYHHIPAHLYLPREVYEALPDGAR